MAGSDILDLGERELWEETESVDSWATAPTSPSNDDLDPVPASSSFSRYPTEMEIEWMRDMRSICEIYETYTPRLSVPNPKLRSPRLPMEICLLIVGYTLRIDWVSSDLDEDESSHVLPILNELRLDFHNNGDRLRQFCAILSRCLPSPTLSSIRIRTEIDVEEWEYLPKLNEKGMLIYVPYSIIRFESNAVCVQKKRTALTFTEIESFPQFLLCTSSSTSIFIAFQKSNGEEERMYSMLNFLFVALNDYIKIEPFIVSALEKMICRFRRRITHVLSAMIPIKKINKRYKKSTPRTPNPSDVETDSSIT
ncbi:hypothetical protein ABKN59_010464 [Abortiporus biennis]